MKGRPTDYGSIVRAHWKSATGYILASRQPCIQIRDDEVKRIDKNRVLKALASGQWPTLGRAGPWILAFILCPGDSVADLVKWVKTNKVDPKQIWFFLHTDTDMAVLQPWADAGLPTDQADFVDDWEDLHALFGLYLSDYIYEAFGPPHTQTWKPGRRSGN